jgi:hypothetical protein
VILLLRSSPNAATDTDLNRRTDPAKVKNYITQGLRDMDWQIGHPDLITFVILNLIQDLFPRADGLLPFLIYRVKR